MKIDFNSEQVFNDFYDWSVNDRKIAKKIMDLVKDINRSPFSGIGKPEPLKYDYAGYWSRRITDEHRLVYKVEDDTLTIVSCKFHYDTVP
jgi:toxin YoeB